MKTPRQMVCEECGHEGPGKAPWIGAYLFVLIVSLVAALVFFWVFPPVLILFLILAAVVLAIVIRAGTKPPICEQCGANLTKEKQEEVRKEEGSCTFVPRPPPDAAIA
ncbi:MAG: hypothetical protein JRI97_10120 [Deltaproteobacteria bacterium]|nr:hypothetical protein [Deltaproteobacteria bacterium]